MIGWLVLLACWGDRSYIVEGTVVQVNGPDEVVIDHAEIPGLMGPMVMPFSVRDPSLLDGVEPGHRVLARLDLAEDGGHLAKLRVTGRGAIPVVEAGPGPLRIGQKLPAQSVQLEDGSEIVLGEGQDRPTLVTFLYTRCPMPEFCPATVARLQAVQAQAGPDVRLLAITLDPEHDTPEVLTAFSRQVGADPAIWRFGRASELEPLALSAALTVVRGAEIGHGIRVLLLGADGSLVARYDDHDWSAVDAVRLLRAGVVTVSGGDAPG